MSRFGECPRVFKSVYEIESGGLDSGPELGQAAFMSEPASKKPVEIFTYLDYRAFLNDYYLHKKASARLSFRAFSRKAELRSPNYLKLVIEGQRNLPKPMALRFAKACQLDAIETDYFLALVAFGQAKNLEERSMRYRDLRRFQHYRAVFRLDVAQDTYHSRWYLPAIRELVATTVFREDPVWIAESLRPQITIEEAETGLEALQQLGLLQRDEGGRLQQVSVSVSTGGDRVRSLHLKNYHCTLLTLAASSMDRFPSQKRDVASVTLRLGPDGLQKLKSRLQAFRRELMELSDAEQNTTQVVHVGMQMMPLTELDDGKVDAGGES